MGQPGQADKLVQQKIQLQVTSGPDQGKQTMMESDRLLIGTHPQCDLALSDPAVSRHHAELRVTRLGLMLRDLGSTNGTMANDLLVREVLLPVRSELILGSTKVMVSVLDDTVTHQLAAEGRFGEMLGRTPIMRAIFAKLSRAAASDVTVLLEGDSGTGKELAARALHEYSPRKEGPFVVVDCGALPRSLIESELFGHERGAFTGATHSRQGAFEQADGGTLFLDEIGELELDLQPRLLRAIESGEIKRLGGTHTRKVDIRIVAGTNRHLQRCVAEGDFREDLYYRLAVFQLTLPPLRERKEDIPLLVQHFVDKLSGHRISSETMDRLMRRPWPGNVRQLRNTVERIVAMEAAGGPQVSIVSWPGEPASDPAAGQTVESCARAEVPYKIARAGLLERFEREYLTALLERHGGNLTQSARAAQIDRVYLLRLLDKYDMRKRQGS
jgi:DNA-binding NtrC family response regulator